MRRGKKRKFEIDFEKFQIHINFKTTQQNSRQTMLCGTGQHIWKI